MMEDILLIGFGGHAKSVIDSIERAGQYRIVGYTEEALLPGYRGYKWLGTDDRLVECYEKGIRNACICVGYLGRSRVRDTLYQRVKEIGFRLPVIVDPSAVVSEETSIGEGSFIGKNAVLNAGSKVGKMCIVNTFALVEHNNVIGDYTHLAVRATLCGDVQIGSHCLVGAGATVLQGVQIGVNVIIGANSTILTNVEDNMKRYGVVKNTGGYNLIPIFTPSTRISPLEVA